MIRSVLVSLSLLGFISSRGQIVNVENKRMHSDTTGWMGSAGVSFAFTKNVQEVINTSANAQLQYKTNKDLYLFLANYNLLKGNGTNLANNMFFHLRYNRKLNKLVRWEVFTQLQRDVFADIGSRILTGTGPRFKLHESPRFKLYSATAAMYEHEKEKSNPTEIHNDIRSSSYVSFTYEPSKTVGIVSTTFYQPLFRQIADYRIMNQLSFNFKASSHIAIIIDWNYVYDAKPAGNTPMINYSVTNGINYKF